MFLNLITLNYKILKNYYNNNKILAILIYKIIRIVIQIVKKMICNLGLDRIQQDLNIQLITNNNIKLKDNIKIHHFHHKPTKK